MGPGYYKTIITYVTCSFSTSFGIVTATAVIKAPNSAAANANHHAALKPSSPIVPSGSVSTSAAIESSTEVMIAEDRF